MVEWVPFNLFSWIGDGPLKPSLKQLINQHDLQNYVTLEGWKTRSEIVDLLADSDILLAPSRTGDAGDIEGTPVVLMEASAMGLPVVSTLHSGIPEVVIDGVSGYLVPEGDINSMSEAIIRLIENPQARMRMGSAGKVHIKENYNINKLNDELVSIFQQLID